MRQPKMSLPSTPWTTCPSIERPSERSSRATVRPLSRGVAARSRVWLGNVSASEGVGERPPPEAGDRVPDHPVRTGLARTLPAVDGQLPSRAARTVSQAPELAGAVPVDGPHLGVVAPHVDQDVPHLLGIGLTASPLHDV